MEISTCASAQARPVREFAVPAGRLSDALLVYAQQAGVSIAVSDPRLDRLRTAGVRGRLEIGEALRRLLEKSGLTFTFSDDATVRLVWHTAARRAVVRAKVRSAPPAPVIGGEEIVVVATKQSALLSDYPASISLMELGSGDTARGGNEGTGYVLRRLPGLASTNLGPGRNKIFIRGVADSSFNGESQATISQYLGEARLIYSAPDPDLLLYDIQRVEVLEGPQGTLYGAGTLGGIIRLLPRAPVAGETSLSANGGVRFTRHGAAGFDAAIVGNLPIADRLAARVVAYKSSEGGYIDDPLRQRSNINRNQISGGRAMLRWTPSADWTVDLSVVAQDVGSRDGQYAQTDVGALARKSAIAQPFDNDYRLAALTVTHPWGGKELVSASSFTRHTIDTVFDATSIPGVTLPQVYLEDRSIDLLSNETRLSGRFSGVGHWLIGGSVVYNKDRSKRSLGDVDSPQQLANLVNSTLDTALFGEATNPIVSTLELTLGGRLSYVRQTSEVAGREVSGAFEPTRKQFRALPSAALSWKTDGWLFYGRYQEGYRPGALQISSAGDQVTAQRFERDHIGTYELGLRFGSRPHARLSGSLAGSTASWDDIQADLVDTKGLPFIANIGSGRVRNLSASLTWQPTERWTFDASGFVASSNLSKPALAFSGSIDRDLPSIADEGWRLGARYGGNVGAANVTLDAGLRYVGRSKLAVVTPFDLSQGGYYDVSVGGRWSMGAVGISLDLDNVLDSRANTFAFGNPFSLASGTQTTPLRPRSVRVGVDASF